MVPSVDGLGPHRRHRAERLIAHRSERLIAHRSERLIDLHGCGLPSTSDTVFVGPTSTTMSSDMHQKLLDVRTRGRGLHDITNLVRAVVADSHVRTGLCSLFLQHTSASLVIQENADPAVLRDLDRWMAELAPEGAHYEHDDEGPDDMPAHLRAAVTHTSLVVPITTGQLALGVWQAIYMWEHRTNPHHRRLVVTAWGDKGGP